MNDIPIMLDPKSDDSRFQQTIKKLNRKKQIRRQVLIASLGIVVLIAFISYLFSYTLTFEVVMADVRYVSVYWDKIQSASAAKVDVDRDFKVNITEFEDENESDYCILFLYRQNGRWKSIPFTDGANYPLRFLFSNKNAANSVMSIQNSFIEQIGEYTVIHVSEHDLERQGLHIEDVSDSLGTAPIYLNCELLGEDGTSGRWVFPHFADKKDKTDFDMQIRCKLSESGYLFVIEDMPADYLLTVNGTVLYRGGESISDFGRLYD